MSRTDIYTTVTAQLVAAIEAGAESWSMPWHHRGAPIMRPTSVIGRRYSGINRLILWATADACGYSSGTYGTYQQWKGIGGQVRKGETGTHVILWKKIDRPDAAEISGEGDAAEGSATTRFFARGFCVFNKDQVEGVDGEGIAEVAPVTTPIANALAMLESVGVPVEYGLHDAYFRPDEDKVYMPERRAFISDLDLVSTLAHEITHASGTASRLDRDSLRNYHKDRKARQHEELVAELGASFMMADLGLAYTPRPDHAAYLSSWLNALKSDTRVIFAAAGQAQAAADWIHAHAGIAAAPMPLAA
jgi:antirestriction protein ArdC